ncbi:MAG: FAD-dependent monooxygenase, partial [Chloroflexota bacterium]
DWLIVDVEEAPPADDEVVFSINPERPAVTLPGPGTKRRWEFVVKDDDDIETLTDSNTVQKLLEPWIDGQDVQISRKAIYRFHARSAETYRKGNVFLLGDAAHITPPFAGQGMMAGLRDGYNIAWKLAAVINNRLPDDILNSYDTERRPQNIQVTRFAQYMGHFILPQKAIPAAFRDGVIRFLRLIGLHSDTKPLSLEKIPNHINGHFMRNAIVQRFGRTGVEFPQYTVEREDGSTGLSDRFIDDQFTILSWEEDAGQWLDGTTKERWKQLNGQIKVIAQRPQNSLNADLLIDQSGQYADLFHHGQRVVVIRPDKMMVIHCRPTQLNQKLTRYLNSIGAPQVDQMSQNQRLTIAQ